MLGNPVEAEDIVQDAWIRWQMTERTLIRDPAAFLTAMATRLAINVIQSARTRREMHVDTRLQEPAGTEADPRVRAERGQALAYGVRLLLAKLTPTERAAFILREAFDYPYRDIASVLRLREANVRQLVTRARQHITGGTRMPARLPDESRLVEAVVSAAHGNVAGLEHLLASEVVSPSTCAAAA
jgi:RNA polymerase sigma-70 factor (ECF subfamily)